MSILEAGVWQILNFIGSLYPPSDACSSVRVRQSSRMVGLLIIVYSILLFTREGVQVAEWKPRSDEAYSLDQSLDGG